MTNIFTGCWSTWLIILLLILILFAVAHDDDDSSSCCNSGCGCGCYTVNCRTHALVSSKKSSGATAPEDFQTVDKAPNRKNKSK